MDNCVVKNKGGRPSKLTRTMMRKVKNYVKWCREEVIRYENDGVLPTILPTKEHFCIKIGVSRDTLYEWNKRDARFSDIFEEVSTIHTFFVIMGAMNGEYNTTIAKLFLAKRGYIEKTESKINYSGTLSLSSLYDQAKHKKELRNVEGSF